MMESPKSFGNYF